MAVSYPALNKNKNKRVQFQSLLGRKAGKPACVKIPPSNLDLPQDPQSPLVLKEPALGPSREPEPIEDRRKGDGKERRRQAENVYSIFSQRCIELEVQNPQSKQADQKLEQL